MGPVTVEVWFTDPVKFKDELAEAVITPKFVWTKEAVESGFDYTDWMETFFPEGWEALRLERYTAIWAKKGGGTERFPIWAWDPHDLRGLRNYAKKSKRVVITGLPAAYGLVRNAVQDIAKVQGESGIRSVLHVHGLTQYPLLFGKGLNSVSTGIRTDEVCLPNGKTFKTVPAPYTKWVRALCFEMIDLEIPRNLAIYNTRSLTFAAEYWNKNIDFHPHMRHALAEWEGPKKIKVVAVADKPKKGLVGDKIACDSCSLDRTCKYYRAESVCTLPGNEMNQLATYFQTRDVGTVLEGLGAMMAVGADRLSRGLEVEQELGEIDPEVTKIYDSLFDKGVKLAKLLDPSLARPNVGVVVQNNQGHGVLQQGPTPKALVANIVRELEAQGIPREHITPEIVSRVLGRTDDIDVPQDAPGAQHELPRTPGKP